jgi:hypothetical protein
VHENRRTLGERETSGFITLAFAARLEEMHGPGWREMTHAEALAITLQGIESDRLHVQTLSPPSNVHSGSN